MHIASSLTDLAWFQGRIINKQNCDIACFQWGIPSEGILGGILRGILRGDPPGGSSGGILWGDPLGGASGGSLGVLWGSIRGPSEYVLLRAFAFVVSLFSRNDRQPYRCRLLEDRCRPLQAAEGRRTAKDRSRALKTVAVQAWTQCSAGVKPSHSMKGFFPPQLNPGTRTHRNISYEL